MYVLMIILSGVYTTDVILHDFTSKERCEIALKTVKDELPNSKPLCILK